MSLPRTAPLTLTRIREPFDHPDWVFELKHDGFRAVVYIDRGKVELVSRTGHVYRAFGTLCEGLRSVFPRARMILDGEIVCLDDAGRSQFYQLLRRRQPPSFYAFDLLWLNGRDLRDRPLRDRKSILRQELAGVTDYVLLAQHVAGQGIDLFQTVCENDCEGIVAKWAASPYRELKRRSPWLKVLNPGYSQREGRHEFFEQRRRAS